MNDKTQPARVTQGPLTIRNEEGIENLPLPPLNAPTLTWGKDKPLRFAAGERARFAQARSMHSQFLVGTEVDILRAGPFVEGDDLLAESFKMHNPAPCDYVIRNAVGTLSIVDDWQLEPITPTPEPTDAQP